jgi:nicotinamide-nucleotide amidase
VKDDEHLLAERSVASDVAAELAGIAADALRLGTAQGWTVAVAEGDTGGLLLAQLTASPGSSAVVLGGVVAYDDGLKRSLLGVPAELLQRFGAVSAEAAEAMARGMRQASGARIALASTGIAGPGGARPGKPVGLAYVAAANAHQTLVESHHWQADRTTNRTRSAIAALRLLFRLVDA